MEPLKSLFFRHPLIFSYLGLAIILDLTEVGSIASWAIAYFLGVSGALRFGLARHPIHLALTWVVIVVLYLGWFVLYQVLNDSPYRPSMPFVLCVVAAFKTMRFRDIPTTTAAETSTISEEGDETRNGG